MPGGVRRPVRRRRGPQRPILRELLEGLLPRQGRVQDRVQRWRKQTVFWVRSEGVRLQGQLLRAAVRDRRRGRDSRHRGLRRRSLHHRPHAYLPLHVEVSWCLTMSFHSEKLHMGVISAELIRD